MRGYKLREIEKGKRLDYFFTYYGWMACAALIILITAAYLLFLIFIRPRADIRILWLSDRYNAVSEAVLTEKMEDTFPWDTNRDGKVKITLNCVDFSSPFDGLDLQTKSETAILLSTGNNYIIFANQYAFNWLTSEGLLGTWADYKGYSESPNDDRILQIKLSELAFFTENAILSEYGEMVLCVLKPPEEDALYREEMEMLTSLLIYSNPA